MNKSNNTDYIRMLLPDFELTNEDCTFLDKYLTAWLVDEEIDVNRNTIKLLNKNREAIDYLKNQYAADKIMNVTERMITLSQIAAGQISLTSYKNTKEGIIPVEVVPSFNERISAINALSTLEQLSNINNPSDKKIIVDDIPITNNDLTSNNNLITNGDQNEKA